MSPNRISALTWVLIFGGLLGIGWAWSVHELDATLGVCMIVASFVAICAGVILIWVRSKVDHKH